eukprot:177024-Pyramimonas_sp.AAC.1
MPGAIWQGSPVRLEPARRAATRATAKRGARRGFSARATAQRLRARQTQGEWPSVGRVSEAIGIFQRGMDESLPPPAIAAPRE